MAEIASRRIRLCMRDFASVAKRSAVRELSADPTPLPTRVMLVVTLAVAGWAVAIVTASRNHPAQTDAVALSLSTLTVLFVLRVAGQLLVRTRPPAWLPPNQCWALTPYPVLLPVQLGIVGLLGAAAGKLICKIGAEAVYSVGVLPSETFPRGLGLAVKMEDGGFRGLGPVVVETLAQLGVLDEAETRKLASFHHPEVENRRHQIVGSVNTVFRLH